MRCAVLALTLLSVAAGYEKEWEEFQSKYSKVYATAVEKEKRFSIFKQALDYINAENAQTHNYTLGINRFSDLETDEFAASHMGFKMPEPSQLWGGGSYLGEHTWQGEALPASVDWTKSGAVTEVKDQGDCGSCWIFSSVGALEGAFQIATSKLVSFSEQQILDCDHSWFPPTAGCSGGSMWPVYTYAEKHALCTEESYPYMSGRTGSVGSCALDKCQEGLPKGKVTGWKGLAPIGKIWPASLSHMMSAVNQQPVAVSIAADKPVFHYYKGGVVKGSCGWMPDHGVLVVGYGTDSTLGDYWKVKNSWGPDWGESGFVRIARGVSSRGECAILNSPSYPIVSTSVDQLVV